MTTTATTPSSTSTTIASQQETKKYSFDEYKMYYESTEKVTERRLSINTWNYGICSTTIFAIGVLSGWALSNPEFSMLAIFANIVLSMLGALFCSLWIGQ